MTPEDNSDETLADAFRGLTAPASVADYRRSGAGTGRRHSGGRRHVSRAPLAGLLAVAVVAGGVGLTLGLTGGRPGSPAGVASPAAEAPTALPAFEAVAMVDDPATGQDIVVGESQTDADLATLTSTIAAQPLMFVGRGGHFTQLHPAHLPANVYLGVMLSYDPATGRVVMIADEEVSQPDGGPCSAVAVVSGSQCLRATTSPVTVTYEWTGRDWVHISAADAVSSHIQYLVTDTASHDLIGFGIPSRCVVADPGVSNGGCGPAGGTVESRELDAYRFADGTWVRAGSTRFSGNDSTYFLAVTDPLSGRALLFQEGAVVCVLRLTPPASPGGVPTPEPCVAAPGAPSLLPVFTYSNGRFGQTAQQRSPAIGLSMTAIGDPKDGVVVGYSINGVTYEWADGAWKDLGSAGIPGGVSSALALDPATGRPLLTGLVTTFGSPTTDQTASCVSYRFTGSTWVPLLSGPCAAPGVASSTSQPIGSASAK